MMEQIIRFINALKQDIFENLDVLHNRKRSCYPFVIVHTLNLEE